MEMSTALSTKLGVLQGVAGEYGGGAPEVQAPLEDYLSELASVGSVTEAWLPFVQSPGSPISDWTLGYAIVDQSWCVALRDCTGHEDPENDESPCIWGAPRALLSAPASYRYSAIQMLGMLVSEMVAPA